MFLSYTLNQIFIEGITGIQLINQIVIILDDSLVFPFPLGSIWKCCTKTDNTLWL